MFVSGSESTSNMVHARNPTHHKLNIVISEVLRRREDITVPLV